LPNDDIEQNREALIYQLILELLDGAMYLAPVGAHPGKILDLGTGIGSWAIDSESTTGSVPCVIYRERLIENMQ
jgi:hypothetical protein